MRIGNITLASTPKYSVVCKNCMFYEPTNPEGSRCTNGPTFKTWHPVEGFQMTVQEADEFDKNRDGSCSDHRKR